MRVGLMVAAIVIASGGAAAKTQHKVQVDGANYRVVVDDGIVTVFKKSFVSSYDLKERDVQRKAVVMATGCQVTDEFPNSPRLKGKLVC